MDTRRSIPFYRFNFSDARTHADYNNIPGNFGEVFI